MNPLPAPARATIMIVDGATDQLGIIGAALRRHGYRTLLANCGPLAVALARSQHPDLILMEACMPGMDGLETCRQLKQHSATADIPVIFISSHYACADVVAGLDCGAVDYIAKPLRMPEVCARVRTQLALRAAHAELQRAALLDPLTRIANRRHFDRLFEHEWQRATRSGAPLSLMMVDVDHFKQYNDRLGHAAGDAALCQVARVLQAQAARPTDLAARYGGEEFALLLAETPAASAARLAEAVRAGVAALALPHPASPSGDIVTVSVGVATAVPSAGGDTGSLLKIADSAMYRAKQTGRNRVRAVDIGSQTWETVREVLMA
ncbi:MAG: diguanylate cyclase domain-containing protein [Gammaproteobacteria bacterium]